MDRLDIYEDLPQGMRRYLSNHGWHFSSALCQLAVSKMRDRQGQKVEYVPKEKVEAMLKQNGVTLKNNVGYDATYVYHMARADYFGSSLPDQQHLAAFIQDYLDDPDGTPTRTMDEYIGRCIGKGEPIPWEDVL